MKSIKYFLALLLISSFLVNCTHDPYQPIDGVDGADGAAGSDGADGMDGVDGTASCVNCHNNSHRDSITAAYNISLHSIQTTMFNGQLLAEYTNRTYCAQCHTNQGYIEYMETGAVLDTVPLPTAISCTSCHSDHDTFDFENDGPDYALRNVEPLQLIVDENYHIDYGNTSNSCISCHQPRTAEPANDGNGTFTITSSHWGPHHGPQSTMLEGIQGAQIPGSMGYPGIATATHRTNSTCVSCHMGETTNGMDGSHTMWPTDNACVSCHSSGIPNEVGGLANDMNTLAMLLENVVSQDGTVTGIVHDDHPQPGTYTILEAQAAWNYLFVLEDKSNGIHNPAYSKALIRNSIEALE